MKYFYLSIALVLTVATTAFGQLQPKNKLRSGSVYSYLGVGQPIDYRASYADGMGLNGVAIYDDFSASLANPAFWGRTYFSQATGGLSLNNYNARDYSGRSKNSELTANLFQAVFPLVRNKLGFSLSLSPISRMSFMTYQQTTLPPGMSNAGDSLLYAEQNRGDGGLNRLELGFGYSFGKHLSIGYAPSLVFGPINNHLSILYGSPDYQPIVYDVETKNRGFGNRFGIFYRSSHIFNSHDNLDIGGQVSLPVNLRSRRSIKSDKSVGNGTKTVIIKSEDEFGAGNIRMPMEVTGGLTYSPNNKWQVGSEVLYQQWSDYQNYYKQPENYMSDRYKFAVGTRFLPQQGNINTFFSRFKYNAGVSYDSGYLKLQGQNIETLMFSAGLGILSPKSLSSVDINFHFGIRGTKANNLVKEQIWGVKISLNLAERMFYRPKLQ